MNSWAFLRWWAVAAFSEQIPSPRFSGVLPSLSLGSDVGLRERALLGSLSRGAGLLRLPSLAGASLLLSHMHWTHWTYQHTVTYPFILGLQAWLAGHRLLPYRHAPRLRVTA